MVIFNKVLFKVESRNFWLRFLSELVRLEIMFRSRLIFRLLLKQSEKIDCNFAISVDVDYVRK